uniref:Putative RNA methyltransferase n=1 Tax=Borely moumouvirus TaxID=2712067 RepID=A0A6G6ACG2_9VIRU
MYAEIIKKQTDCYQSLKNFCNSESIMYPIIFHPKNKYYANKLSIDLNNLYEIDTNNISQKIICHIAKEWVNFILSSEYEIYNKNKKTGFWYQLSFKMNTNSELMVKILVIGSDWKNKISKTFFNNFLLQLENKYNIKHSSIYIQWSKNHSCPSKDDNMELIYGDDGISENILGIDFIITPFTFSQGNPYTCDMLYNAIHKFINIDNVNNIICYGRNVGHICFTIKKNITIYGYNPCRVVHKDLKKTIQINKLDVNHLYLDEKCDLISHKLEEQFSQNTVIILSPGRNGLKKNIIESILKNVKKFYYISCYSKSLVRDLNSIGNCVITRIQPINLFPNTQFYEIIVEIELL